MKISIENFKSINKVQQFKIEPLTVLSGVNSAGKSSFFQLLLLLKYSIEQKSQNKPLDLQGGLYEASSFNDLVSNHNPENEIKVSLFISKEEYNELEIRKTTKLFDSLGNYNCQVNIHFSELQSNITISLFEVNFVFEDAGQKNIRFVTDKNLSNFIETNNPAFIDSNFTANDIIDLSIDYNSIFPNQISYKQKFESEDIEGNSIFETQEIYKVVNLTDTKNVISNFFETLYYIGPSRKEPQESYSFKRNYDIVGKNGEYTSQILKDKAEYPIEYYILDNTDKQKVAYIKKEGFLIDAVNYWLCSEFLLANKIWSDEDDGKYRILLMYDNNLEVNIKHVGFGISQLLPIIVQALLMPKGSTLMIEQPELHLHPKIQSKLYDFLYSVTLLNKKLIIETHSSHFITRMRRRIAEDISNEMDDKINLTFIENSLFKTLEIDDLGILDYYPPNFIESDNEELSSIVRAQIEKRKNKKNEF